MAGLSGPSGGSSRRKSRMRVRSRSRELSTRVLGATNCTTMTRLSTVARMSAGGAGRRRSGGTMGPFLPQPARASIAMAVLALTGCGKKGPIVPPERRLPAPPSDMRATVDDRVIVVQFVAPKTRVDNSRLRDLTLMRLFRREEPPEGPLKPAMRSGERVVGYVEIARIDLG